MATRQEKALLHQEKMRKQAEDNMMKNYEKSIKPTPKEIPNCKMSFVSGWTLNFDKVPEYSEFNGEFIEQLDYKLCQIILDNENPRISNEMKTLFKSSIVNRLTPDGINKIIHNQRFNMGRYYPDNDGSIIVHARVIKHTLFKYMGYKDIDQVKGHPSILVEMGKLNNKTFETIQYYIDNFGKVAKKLIKFYSKEEAPLTNEDIKYLFNMTIYGGGFDTWKNHIETGDIKKGYEPKPLKTHEKHQFYIDFKNECDKFKELVYENNPTMKDKFKNYGIELYEIKNKMISYFLQTLENHFIYELSQYLLENNIIQSKKYCLEYDGLCIPPFKTKMTEDEIIEGINNRLFEKTGFNIKYKFKDYGDNVCFDLIELRDNYIEPTITNNEQNEHKDIMTNTINQKKELINQQNMKLQIIEAEILSGINIELNMKFKSEIIKSLNKENKQLEKDERKLDKFIKDEEKQLKQKMKDNKVKDKEEKLKKVNPILFDLTDAGFARQFADLFFKMDNGEMPLIIFTGTDEILHGYKFNGVYWEDIMHQAELHKEYFDKLYKYYENELYKSKEFTDDITYRGFVSGIKKLNSYHDRCNILKVFKTGYYVKDIKWNMNKDLYVFEDCIYNLSLGSFIEPNPTDYVNMTCGYKYNIEFDPLLIKQAKKEILKFVDSIMDGENERNYLLKVYSKGLKQSNDDEKAYFLLGDGRNGKGTNSLLISRALGKYWGTLNIEYYTTHRKSADEPNQNLFNCRNARILSTSEANDENERGQKVKFLHDKFQTLTGKGTLTPRKLGEQETASFEAGIPIFDFNYMVDFSKKDMSCIKERVEIIKFNKTFTQYNYLIDENPDKYKMVDTSLKSKFESNLYRRATIDLLFEYYNKNVIRPDSVKKDTDAYFNNETLISWISSNCDKDDDESVELNDIKEKYTLDTDKKITVKQIKDELDKNKYIVWKSNGYYKLKGYKLIN